MSRIVNLWLWCHGYKIEIHRSVEPLPGGWQSYATNIDNNPDPNAAWVNIPLGGI